MTGLEPTGYDEFDRLTGLVSRTRAVLDALLGDGSLPSGGADFLATTTLPHFERVEAGFRTWLRPEMAGLAELQHLVLQIGALRVEPPRNSAERRAAVVEGLLEGGAARLEAAHDAAWDLLGLAHARLALGLLPRLPEAAVHFPAGRRTYADIPAPRGPAELAARIEEIERQLWRTATGRRTPRLDPAFRRTYAFFDAAERLGRRPSAPS
jgi:hypothetical protein